MRRILLLFLAAVCALAQTSNYPGSIDTDTQLFVLSDNLQTTLSVAMAAGDSVAVVASTTGWTANMIATICDTQSSSGKCTAWEHMLVTSVVNANTLALNRGFAGTVAASHAAGRFVSVLYDAAHQKVLSSAVKAIENALGANLANIPISPLLNSKSYGFTPQAPGGSLTPGANTITFPNGLPPGIAAGSVNVSKVYISGGTGAAEAVPIIGVNTGANQITVTCANSHSGAWTVQSASSGIQEGIIAAGPLGGVYIPAGTWNVYGTITVPAAQQVSLFGAGVSSTALALQFGAGDGILYDATTYALASINGFRFDSAVTRTSGYDLHVKGATIGTVENLYSRNTANGFEFENCNAIQVHDLQVQNYTGIGFFLNASGTPTSGGFYSHLVAAGAGNVGMLIQAAVGSAFAGTTISDCNFQSAVNAFELNPNGGALNEFHFSGLILDSYTARGMYFVGGSGGGNGISLRGVRMGGAPTAGFSIGMWSNWSNIEMSEITGGGPGVGIEINGSKNIGIHNSHISGDGSAAGGNLGLLIQDDSGTVANSIQVSDSTFGFNESGGTTGQTETEGVSITAAAHANIRINNVSAYGSASSGTLSLSNLATGAGNVITNSNFVGHTPPTVASAATLAIPAEQDLFFVSGTTGVTAVSTVVAGQVFRFVATNASPGAWTAGSTIGSTFTPTQNVPVVCAVDGALKAWCK